jgi:hypothetical protein
MLGMSVTLAVFRALNALAPLNIRHDAVSLVHGGRGPLADILVQERGRWNG